MRRVPFKRGTPPARPAGRQWEGGEITPRAPAPRCAPREAETVAPIAKENALQDRRYMAIVRKLPCAHCGRPPPNQFCHLDLGKGQGLKTDCRQGWPGCGDDILRNRIGCHTLVCSTGKFTKEQRRHLEATYAARTRDQVLASGKWPKGLPLWDK